MKIIMKIGRFLFSSFILSTVFYLCGTTAIAAEPGKTVGADWPRIRRDAQLTGFSPLKGGLDRAPHEMWSADLGGPMVGLETVRIEDINGDGHTKVLRVRKDGLICQDLRGKKLWEALGLAAPVIQDIRDFAGDGGRGILVEYMDGLKTVRAMIDGKTGERADLITIENHFGGSMRIGHILPGVPGQQYCHWWSGDEHGHGYLFSFENGPARPTVRFKRQEDGVIYAPIHALADIDGDGQAEILMISHEQLWAYDLKTQERKFYTTWRDEKIRSYSANIGILPLKRGELPSLLLISPHIPGVEVVRQDGKGKSSIVWKKLVFPTDDQYQPEVKIGPGAPNPFMDIDNDGYLEIMASVSNEHKDGKTRLVIFNADNGDRLFDEPDISVLGVDDLDGDGKKPEVLLKSGDELRIANWTGKTFSTRWQARGVEPMFKPLPPELDLTLMHSEANPTLWREQSGSSQFLMRFGPEVWSCRLAPVGQLEKIKKIERHEALHNAGKETAPPNEYTWDGRTLKTVVDGQQTTGYENDLQRSYLAPTPIAGDLDGHLTVLVKHSDGTLLLISTDGKDIRKSEARPPVGNYEICDLDGDGRNEILTASSDAAGKPTVVVLDAVGKVTHTYDLPGKTATLGPTGCLGPNRGRWFVVQSNNAYESPALFAFDGKTGKQLWRRPAFGFYDKVPYKFDLHIPTAVYDYDKDGVDDLITLSANFYGIIDVKNNKDLVDPMAKPFMSDTIPGHWTTYAVASVAPILGTAKPQIILSHSYAMSLLVLDLEGWPIWHYGTTRDGMGRTLAAIADMDGDGKMELVSARSDGLLSAFDAAPTNEKCPRCPKDVPLSKVNHGAHLRWKMQLPAPVSDFASADLDGDGKVEILCGAGDGKLHAIKEKDGKPGALWTVDFGRTAGSPILADLDGDGTAEILITTEDGRLRALRSSH